MGSSFDLLNHKSMLRRCDGIVEKLRRDWTNEITACVTMTWCSEPLKADDSSKIINDTVIMELPLNQEEWWPLMIKLIVKTKALGILLIRFWHDETKIIFESPWGSRSWSMKTERHGDTKALSRPIVLDDVEAIGLLWNKNKATA